MAAYTSSGSGDFSNVATWGGGGYPSIAADTFTVAAGHTVSVDVYSTVELGASTINGTLTHKAGGVRRLLFNHNDLVIGATGNLGGGNMVANGDAFIIEWNTTADNAKGINKAAGAIVNLVGDPAFYGSSDNTVTAATWSSGRVVSVVGDYLTKWMNVGVERVSNGSFDADSNWVKESGWSISGGKLVSASSGTTLAYQTGGSYALGESYILTYEISSYISGTVEFHFGGLTSPGVGVSRSSNGIFTEVQSLQSGAPNGNLVFRGVDFNGSIDNVSVKKITPQEVLGPELVSNGTFTTDLTGWAGTNWAWNAATTARHTAGSTSALAQAGLAAVVGKLYKVVYTISNRTVGAVTPAFGGVTMDTDTGNATFTHYLIANSTNTLAFGPGSTFDGDIDNVSVKEVLSGREILVHKNAAYSNYNTDVLRASIHSMTYDGGTGATSITIGEAAPGATFNSGGIVVNPSRNVIIGKLNADRRIGQYNTNRPRIIDNATTRGTMIMSNVETRGIWRYVSESEMAPSDTIHRNGAFCFVYKKQTVPFSVVNGCSFIRGAK